MVGNMCLHRQVHVTVGHERMGQGAAMEKEWILAASALGELTEVVLSAFPTAFGLDGLKVLALLEASFWCCNI